MDNYDSKLINKVLELWPHIQQKISYETQEGRKIASSLCRWIGFVEKIDED